jgi:hypothetical protein
MAKKPIVEEINMENEKKINVKIGKNDKYDYWETSEFDNLYEIIDFVMTLRLPQLKEKYLSKFNWKTGKGFDEFLSSIKEQNSDSMNSFWSFRGQKDPEWDLVITPRGNVNIPNEAAHYGTWYEQYKTRMTEFYETEHLEQIKEKDKWNWLFYAKHHELYTRLLDWSSNPLVAIYFAVENILSTRGNPAVKEKGGAVWALKVNKDHFFPVEQVREEYSDLDPVTAEGKVIVNGEKKQLTQEDWFMINPEPITKRIARQSCKFTYHPGPTKQKPINHMDRRQGEVLVKININPDAKDVIRKQLGIMNIHHASLFPSPTGVAHFVNSEWPDIARY